MDKSDYLLDAAEGKLEIAIKGRDGKIKGHINGGGLLMAIFKLIKGAECYLKVDFDSIIDTMKKFDEILEEEIKENDS